MCRRPTSVGSSLARGAIIRPCVYIERASAWAVVKLVAIAATGVLLMPRGAIADSVRLVWTPVPLAAGYKVYVRSAGEQYGAGTDVGNLQPDTDGVVRHIIDGLDLERTLYFVVTTYDDTGQEGWFSNELRLIHTVMCAPAPRTDCRTPLKTKLLLNNKEGIGRDRARWQWKQGSAITEPDLGDPLTSTNYILCVYDEAGGVPRFAMSASALAGEVCDGEPCWRRIGTRGFKYDRGSRGAGGVFNLFVKLGNGRRAKLQATATELGLPLPDPVNGMLLMQDTRVVVQLVNDAEPPVCWESEFTSPARTNSDDAFVDQAE